MRTETELISYEILNEMNQLLRDAHSQLAPYVKANPQAARLQQELAEHGLQLRATIGVIIDDPKDLERIHDVMPSVYSVNHTLLQALDLLEKLTNVTRSYPYSTGTLTPEQRRQSVASTQATPVPRHDQTHNDTQSTQPHRAAGRHSRQGFLDTAVNQARLLRARSATPRKTGANPGPGR